MITLPQLHTFTDLIYQQYRYQGEIIRFHYNPKTDVWLLSMVSDYTRGIHIFKVTSNIPQLIFPLN